MIHLTIALTFLLILMLLNNYIALTVFAAKKQSG